MRLSGRKRRWPPVRTPMRSQWMHSKALNVLLRGLYACLCLSLWLSLTHSLIHSLTHLTTATLPSH